MRYLIFIIIILIPMPIFAEAIGWHWYNEIYEAKEKPVKNKPIKPKTAEAEMTKLRETVREAKAKAILYPTEENVREYITLQNLVAEKASMFSSMWQKVLLDFPELSYAVLHPTENNAQHVLYEQDRQKENQAIAAYREKYGMFFFYRGDNLLDQELAPTIASFSKENQISLIPISVDGKILPVFVESTIDKGQAKKLGVKYFPALILVEPKSRAVQPLNYGFISLDELRHRFLQVATNFKE